MQMNLNYLSLLLLIIRIGSSLPSHIPIPIRIVRISSIILPSSLVNIKKSIFMMKFYAARAKPEKFISSPLLIEGIFQPSVNRRLRVYFKTEHKGHLKLISLGLSYLQESILVKLQPHTACKESYDFY